jgi:alpha-glucosidase
MPEEELLPWWREAVIYQIYPRSFQDTDGDGVGDLAGVRGRLNHLRWLGVDALWLCPIYPSGGIDGGYDITDFTAVDPTFGTAEEFRSLVDAAHTHGLKVLVDFVPCHTSIEHPWFREHPERYFWADDGPPNNWLSIVGDSAWALDPRSGRWYLHTYYREQADLNWRHSGTVRAMQDVLRHWLALGVDGFRIDSVEGLLKDPQLRDDPSPTSVFPLPLPAEYAQLAHTNSLDAPDIADALRAIRSVTDDALLIGEVYLPAGHRARYLRHLDIAFSFELLHAPWNASALRAAIASGAAAPGTATVLSNHDFPRIAGRADPRLAAMLLLTLPGPAFVYQGDELGLLDGVQPDIPVDAVGRDPYRTPLPWDSTPNRGFSTGVPWLPVVPAGTADVARQQEDSGSLLHLYRRLIRLKRRLGGDLEFVDIDENVVAFRRGAHGVVLNLTDHPVALPPYEEVLIETAAGSVTQTSLAAGQGAVYTR